jgi:MFS family permease
MLRDGIAFSAMVGLGESYLPAFALALGYGSVTAGLVATLPMLAGALFQLATPAAVGLLGSHRRWVVLCAALQALTFIPLIVGALAGQLALELVYLTAALYWGLGMSTGPAWTAWATTLVPKSIRPRFFAQRARASQASLFIALVVGGLLLDRGRADGWPMAAFALIFSLALGSRVLSATFLASQSEPQPAPIGETRISPETIRNHIRTGGHAKLLLYLLVFQLSVWIAAPYFTPYMLGPLGLSYAEFTWLTATAFMSRVLVLPALGSAARRWGTRRLLSLASFGIVPLPALWLVSDSFAWLIVLQLLSGAVWAGFELASLLSFFERIPPRGQTSVLTVYNLANALAIVGGSAIGGFLLGQHWPGFDGFMIVLVVSSSARLLSLALLRGVSETVEPDSIPSLRTLSVRPSTGAVQRPILMERESPSSSASKSAAN